MAKSRSRKIITAKSPRDVKQSRKRQRRPEKPEQIPALAQAQLKRYEIIMILVVLALGIYLSVLYFGHQPVPNPDYTAFVQTGRQLLSFKLPGSFKRAPVLGVLQVGLSYLMPGPHPELTAGWLLNAILYTLTGLLLYLVGKRFIGKWAIWFALLALINPWSLTLLRQPIAETTLKFFAVLTIYLILKRSRWRYVAAAAATMVRYDGAGLILAAFVMDIIESKAWRSRFKALLWSALASVPLALWILGMLMTRKPGAPAPDYFRHYDVANRNAVGAFIRQSWEIGIGALFGTHSQSSFQLVVLPSQVLLVVCLLTAVGYGLYKKNWSILALLSFAVPYFFAHSLRFRTIPRHTVAVSWVVLLLCCYGLYCIWKLINGNNRVPRLLVIALQSVLLVGALVWLILLAPHLSELKQFSLRSVSVPYVAIAAVILVLLAGAFIYRSKYLFRDLAVSALMCLMVVSIQFSLAQQVQNGAQDAEFKDLAQWYVKNYQPGDKLLTTVPHLVWLFAPEYRDKLVKTSHIGGKTFDDFVQQCRKRKITYVAWDSRIGRSPNNSYYRQWKVGRIHNLGHFDFLADSSGIARPHRRLPRDVPPFVYVDEIPNKYDPRRLWIYIYRLDPELVGE